VLPTPYRFHIDAMPHSEGTDYTDRRFQFTRSFGEGRIKVDICRLLRYRAAA